MLREVAESRSWIQIQAILSVAADDDDEANSAAGNTGPRVVVGSALSVTEPGGTHSDIRGAPPLSVWCLARLTVVLSTLRLRQLNK